MKIVQINAVYNIGSTGRIVKDLNDISLSKGYDSIVACSITSEDKCCYKIGNVLDHKIHAFLSRISGKQAYFSKIATKNFLFFLDQYKPDIIHVHNLHANYININMLLDYIYKKNISLVITLHDCWYYTGKCFHYTRVKCNKWKTGCNNCPKRYSDTPAYLFDSSEKVFNDRKSKLQRIKKLYVVGVSKWIANEAKKSIIKSAHILYCYNGVDLNIFKPTQNNIRNNYGLGNSFIVLCMANKWELSENRQQRELLLSMINCDFKIVVIGKTNDVKKNNGEIYIPPIKDPKQLAEWYSAADVFLNLTWEDSLPFVNIESIACGTPVITHDTSGASEIIDDNTGKKIEPGNIDMLKKALETIKNNGKMHYESYCVKRAKALFDYKNSYNKYFEIYKEIDDYEK